MNEHQIELVSIDSLVSEHHPYRKLKEFFDFDSLGICKYCGERAWCYWLYFAPSYDVSSFAIYGEFV